VNEVRKIFWKGMYNSTVGDFKIQSFTKYMYYIVRELATSLLTVKPVGVNSTTLVQYLYISCYLSDNKPVLSYLLLCLLPQW
jgi:hypothetical protein